MEYKIYQLDMNLESVKNSHKLFERWDWLQKYEGGFNFKDYKEVYRGETESDLDQIVLENLFQKFNLSHPLDFQGHSLSVSDVVVLEGERMYYCDSIGWRRIYE